MDGLLGDGGFVAALLASVVLALGAWFVRREVRVEWPAVAVGGSLVGLSVEGRIGPPLVWAVVLLVAGGALAMRAPVPGQVAMCVPGAIVLSQAVTGNADTWMRALVIATTAVGAPLVLGCARELTRVTPCLLAATVVGVFVCVPETGPIHSVLGAIVPAVLLGVVVVRAPHPAGLFPLVGLVVWAAVTGGETRPGAVVGGLACFGVLWLPAVLPRRADLAVLGVQCGLVVFVARVAGFRDDALHALLLSLAAFLVAVVVLGAVRVAQRGSAASSR